jgi:hypothetical protein
MNKTIKIDGYLKETPKHSLDTGDVYVRGSCIQVLLIRPFYSKDEYILVGVDGLRPYSNAEYQKVLSREEVVEIFNRKGYKFSHNITDKVRELMENPKNSAKSN